jgi:2-haloacid dehalogenase
MIKKYTHLLFDADGTLFDYETAEAQALADNFAHHGLDFQPAHGERYQAINHRFWQRFEQGLTTAEELHTGRFQALFGEFGIKYDADFFANTYLAQLGQQAQLIAGAAELIAELHGRYHLTLITNGLANVQYPRLQKSGLAGYFEAIIVSDEIGAAKPDPAIFDVTFERLQRPSKETVLIIGDSLTSDMAGGRSYGIDTCWYNPSGRPAELDLTYEIRKLSQLRNILS